MYRLYILPSCFLSLRRRGYRASSPKAAIGIEAIKQPTNAGETIVGWKSQLSYALVGPDVTFSVEPTTIRMSQTAI